MKRLFFLSLLFMPLQLISGPIESNVLVSGTVQITSEIDAYQNIVPGGPILGSVMVTHQADNPVNIDGFSFDGKALQVEFVQSVPMTAYGSLVVSIYHFKLKGMKTGVHTLPAIKAQVGGITYEAPPMTIIVE